MNTTRQPGVLLVAASALRRTALQKLLSAFMPAGTIQPAPAFSPDRMRRWATEIVVADLDSPAEANSMLRFVSSGPAVSASVALIDYPDPHWVRRALAAGVNAIISREAAEDDLHLAIDAADAGFVLLHPSSARLLIESGLKNDGDAQLVEHLTAREHQVLKLMSVGLGNKEIAVRLGISEHTVKFHASSILGKLGVSSRTEAVSQGIRRGLISL